ncbi:dTDP-4-dehydrorhamnose 3,5-epimerase [Enhydrobacter aerosaccus]|uniref:dTDP-4-dehydrorhamnose 3,5-epimerase n=1 Tax=Enhydrobacter aerosaccus TaxID=225324 RepID=A0A1T4T707_9HYPH|nr:dTDP-4-dehydrorhamnose 3,5-epimerase [Enhydrobacter aerosaccus]SKA36280.1 dTDP-4-dehydrorhamnose 3,5-epimerase [Enhydrobacter aerosaccus]
MIFTKTKLEGVWVIDLDRHEDERGFFARSYCAEEFAQHGLPAHFVQCNISFNKARGTLRGLHFQDDPHPEGKLVRCVQGAIFDVAVDLRPHSQTYLTWVGYQLSADNGRALFIDEGFAHGFQTLEKNTAVFYQMTECFYGNLARGLRWNDPALGIQWPLTDPVISERDAAFPLISS